MEIDITMSSNPDVEKRMKKLMETVEEINAKIKVINNDAERFETAVRDLDTELHRLGLLREGNLVSLPLKIIWEEFMYNVSEELWSVKSLEDVLKRLLSEKYHLETKLKTVDNYLSAQRLVLQTAEKLLPKLKKMDKGCVEEKFSKHTIAVYRSARALLKNQFSVKLAEAGWAERKILEDHLQRIKHHVNTLEAQIQTMEEQKMPGDVTVQIRELNDLVGEITLCQKIVRQNIPSVQACLEELITELKYVRNVLPASQIPECNWEPADLPLIDYFMESFPESTFQDQWNKRKAGLVNYKSILDLYFLELDSVHGLIQYEIVPAIKMLWTYYDSICNSGISMEEDWEEAVENARKKPWEDNSNTVLENKHLILLQYSLNYINGVFKMFDKLVEILNRSYEELNFDARREAINEIYKLDKVRTQLRLNLPQWQTTQSKRERLKDRICLFEPDKLMQC